MNALILIAALTGSPECRDCMVDPPPVVLASAHDACVAFAGTASLTHHRHFAPIRNSRARRAYRGGWYLGKRGWRPGMVLRFVFRGRCCR